MCWFIIHSYNFSIQTKKKKKIGWPTVNWHHSKKANHIPNKKNNSKITRHVTRPYLKIDEDSNILKSESFELSLLK